MSHPSVKMTGKEIATQWDGRGFLGRLKIILDNRDLFWSLGLITTSELEMVIGMPESAIEYIVSREDQPFFTSIDLKKDLAVQNHRDKLIAALRAVFL
jgi:hypothetical protein